jgi:hypothetical protein
VAPHRRLGDDGGLCYDNLARLLNVIWATDCDIVLSSAWRYHGCGLGSVFVQCLFGSLDDEDATTISRRIIGTTRLETEPEPRHLAILDWVAEHKPEVWVAVDDLDDIRNLGEGHYVQTDGNRGLTFADAQKLIELLGRKP